MRGASLDRRANAEGVDLFVIGGGINGGGIARDAVGRGLSVELAEMNDLASATSSASTKLFTVACGILNTGKYVWSAKR
jgi:glycerol-3-phosphate dehydrogenase